MSQWFSSSTFLQKWKRTVVKQLDLHSLLILIWVIWNTVVHIAALALCCSRQGWFHFCKVAKCEPCVIPCGSHSVTVIMCKVSLGNFCLLFTSLQICLQWTFRDSLWNCGLSFEVQHYQPHAAHTEWELSEGYWGEGALCWTWESKLQTTSSQVSLWFLPMHSVCPRMKIHFNI